MIKQYLLRVVLFLLIFSPLPLFATDDSEVLKKIHANPKNFKTGVVKAMKDWSHLNFSDTVKPYAGRLTTISKLKNIKFSGTGTRILGNIVLTCAHNFLDVPTKPEKKSGTLVFYKKSDCHFLDFDLLECGLTTKKFVSDDKDVFFETEKFYKLSPAAELLVNQVHSKKDIKNIYLNNEYIKKDGLYYAIDESKDIAKIYLNKSDEILNIEELDLKDVVLSKDSIQKMITYHYPFGHPIQKTSFGLVKWEDHDTLYCHDLPTIGGSSGSSLIDETGNIVAIHVSGIDQEKNFAIPVTKKILHDSLYTDILEYSKK